MSLDLNSLIAQPQANAAATAPVAAKSQPLAATEVNNAPVIQEPIAADTFKPEVKNEEKKANNALDQILKYSGVAALIVTPVALFAFSKKAGQNLTKAINEISEKIVKGNAVAENISDQVTGAVYKNNKISVLLDRIAMVLTSSDGIDIFTNKAVKTVKIK